MQYELFGEHDPLIASSVCVMRVLPVMNLKLAFPCRAVHCSQVSQVYDRLGKDHQNQRGSGNEGIAFRCFDPTPLYPGR